LRAGLRACNVNDDGAVAIFSMIIAGSKRTRWLASSTSAPAAFSKRRLSSCITSMPIVASRSSAARWMASTSSALRSWIGG